MFDFSIPRMTFTQNNSNITLTGDKTLPFVVSYQNLCHLLHGLHSIFPSPYLISPTYTDPRGQFGLLPSFLFLPPDLQSLLTSSSTISQTPHNLPLPQPHYNQIPLLPNTSSVKVNPYHYPHAHDETMTKLIDDLL